MKTRIYLLESAMDKRLVRAASQAQVLSYVARKEWSSIDGASQDDLEAAFKAGMTVEQSIEHAEDAK
jgi:hypothetical protein